MKHILPFILFLFIELSGFSQTFDVENIKYSGADDKRINLIVLSEGYQESELNDFITDATNFSTSMFGQSPFKEYADYFNVYAIKVPSNESGADHPRTGAAADETNFPIPTTSVDTYFNATFDAFGYHRYLYYGIDYANAASAEAKIRSVLTDNFPSYDVALILVNTPYYGGTGGEFPIASSGADGIETAIHELGHSLFNLKDEYYGGDVYVGEAINMTQENDPTLVKWKNWLGINNIGIYPHSGTPIATTWYKPQSGNKCKMETLYIPFCSVCKEGIIEKIHDLVSPIDSYLPNNNTIENPSLPLDFELDLIHPTTNSLERVWTLNASNFDSDNDSVSLTEINLLEGTNTLTAVVNDNTSFLKVDNHETIHVYSVTWTINYSTLGIGSITSETNNFNISVFPNPSNAIVNFKFESTLNTPLSLEIIGIDGKKMQSYNLSHFEDLQIDMSTWSQGIYIAQIYADQVLIATKKLAKK
jgi:hypothetical protein